MKEVFRAPIKDDVHQLYVSDQEFESSNDAIGVGSNLYVFDIPYQRKFRAAEPKNVECKFSRDVPPVVTCYAVVLPSKLISSGSDGIRHFHLIYFL